MSILRVALFSCVSFPIWSMPLEEVPHRWLYQKFAPAATAAAAATAGAAGAAAAAAFLAWQDETGRCGRPYECFTSTRAHPAGRKDRPALEAKKGMGSTLPVGLIERSQRLRAEAVVQHPGHDCRASPRFQPLGTARLSIETCDSCAVVATLLAKATPYIRRKTRKNEKTSGSNKQKVQNTQYGVPSVRPCNLGNGGPGPRPHCSRSTLGWTARAPACWPQASNPCASRGRRSRWAPGTPPGGRACTPVVCVRHQAPRVVSCDRDANTRVCLCLCLRLRNGNPLLP